MSATTANDNTTINNQDDTTVPTIFKQTFKRFAIATFVLATTAIIIGDSVSSYKNNTKSSGRLLRSLRVLQGQGRGRPMVECTLNLEALMQIPGAAPIAGGDEVHLCDDGGDKLIPMKFDGPQLEALKDKAAMSEIIYGNSKIDVEGVEIGDDGTAVFPGNKPITALPNQNPWAGRNLQKEEEDHEGATEERKLQAGTGVKKFILFRVTDGFGEVHPHDAATMSDNMFGTNGDTINLKTQLDACSAGKYTVEPGGKNGYDFTGLESAPGVVDITIDISLDSPRSTVRDAIRLKAREVMRDHFGGESSTLYDENQYMDHALYSLKTCVQDCGWAAYASAPGYYQVYQSNYYAYAGVQL